MMVLIEATGVEKLFGFNSALRLVDLSVEVGSVFVLFGCNGVGKMTFVRIFFMLFVFDVGEFWIGGVDVCCDFGMV